MSGFRLGLLGGFEMTGEDGAPLPIGMRKAKALLVWLALRPAQPQPRERLAGLLWGESGEAQARHSLRQALSQLRRALPDADAVLRAEGEMIALVPDAITSDVAELQHLAAADNLRDLERAAALYRGEFLEGFSARASEFEDWMLAERSRLRELAAQILGRLLEHYRGDGAWEPALRAAMRLLALEPLRESVHRELMMLYVRLGRPAEALRQYRTCQALLHRELGVAPESETRDLYRRLLAERQQTRSPASVPAAVFRETGVPSRAAPDPDFDLVGRQAELGQLAASLDACLEAGAGGTLLVRGEAGIGKTRLTEAATRLAQTRGYRIHRIQLFEAGTEAPEASTATLLRELMELPSDADQERTRAAVAAVCSDANAALFLLDALGASLSTAEDRFYQALDIPSRAQGTRQAAGRLLRVASRRRPRLLVVEDIHWAEAGLLGLLAELTADAGSVPGLLLLTTRTEGEPLDPAWRGAMQGAPLTTVDLGPLRAEAVRDLARRLGTGDDAWAQRCVARAGGNPLFLEHLLAAGPDVGDAVPASVQELVERRLARLPPEDRRTAQAAAVLGQRFSARALADLLGGQPDPCRALCEAQLLSANGDQFRFSHALVRDGIYQSIAGSARRALHRRAADWYSGCDRVLHAEHLEQAEDPAAVAAYLQAAQERLDRHRYEDARELGERAWRLAEGSEMRAKAGLFLGVLSREMGDIAAARRVLDAVIAGSDTKPLICDARIELAAALLVQDDYPQALENLDLAVPLAEALGEHGRMARLYSQRGNALFPLGRLDDCMAAHNKALEHARAAGEAELEARALSGLADAYYQRGRMVTAHHYFDRCLRLCEANGLLRVQAPNLAGRGMAALYLNRLEDSLRDTDAAARLAALTHSQRDECLAHNVFSIAAIYAGDIERAERAVDAGLAIACAIGARRFEADHLCMRGVIRAARGEKEPAREDLEAATRLVRESDMAYGGPWTLGFLALLVEDAQVRRSALADGEAALAADSVSHNHLQFRQCALEIALEERDWDALDRQADAMERYTRDEPLPWSDFYVARARVLMDWERGDRRPGMLRRLRALEAEARQAGLEPALAALSAARRAAEDGASPT